MKVSKELQETGEAARGAAVKLAESPGSVRREAILEIAEELASIKTELFKANNADVQEAKKAGISEHFLKRLEISEKVFNYMCSRLVKAADLPDPLGRLLSGHRQPDGLQVKKISVPIGVVSVIYESRPNVTTDAAAVCLKSGNAVILRGGSDSYRSNSVMVEALQKAIVRAGLPGACVQYVSRKGHEAVSELLAMDDYIDLIIPRGGKGLIKKIAEGTQIPVIKHYEGLCHLYVAPDALEDKAVSLAINSKCQRVEVCNSLETILVDENCEKEILSSLLKAFKEKKVECRVCPEILKLFPELKEATEEDWKTEYLAPVISIKSVAGLEDAVKHINHYGSGHTDVIVTESIKLAEDFINKVDSASVMVNASTRLSGGGDYGMGAVIGISTDKFHARGPVGPEELTSYKWVVYGDGHLRG